MASHDNKPNPFAKVIEIVNNSEFNFEAIKHAQAEKLPELVPQDLSGKVVVVTGANAAPLHSLTSHHSKHDTGIGYEITKSLASMKPEKLIMACRSATKAEAAKTEIQNATGCKNIEVWELDLASFASVKTFSILFHSNIVQHHINPLNLIHYSRTTTHHSHRHNYIDLPQAKKFNDTGLPLHILVSNAGVSSPDWVVTADGFEITQQVNHLANMLLVLELTPVLAKTLSSRVVVVASDVHFWAQAPNPEDPTPVSTTLKKPDPVPVFYMYPISKLYNVLFAQEYARRYPKVWICSANPGYTESELGTKDAATGEAKGSGGGLPGLQRRTTYEGAKTLIHAAIDPHVGASGEFYSEMKSKTPRSSTVGPSGAQFGSRVWRDTVNLIKPQLSVTDEWIFN